MSFFQREKPSLSDNKLFEFFEEYSKTGCPIEVNFRELVHWVPYRDSYTHYMHSYPAKLIKHIPIFFLQSQVILPHEKSIVLDPFCGSGTVLLESILNGHHGYGCDSNPLARTISKVKTRKVSVSRIKSQLEEVVSLKKCGKKPEFSNLKIDYWFPKRTQEVLFEIKANIEMIKDVDVRDFYMVVFSNIIRKSSYSDPRLSVPVRIKPEKYNVLEQRETAEKALYKVENLDVVSLFRKSLYENIKRIECLNSEVFDGEARVIGKDARSITKSLETSECLDESSVDLILTSPPYAGAQKYIRSSSLSLEWLGFCDKLTLRGLEKENIGREHYSKNEYKALLSTGLPEADEMLKDIWDINKLRAHISGNYLMEMKAAISEMYRVLKKGKYCIIVVGNNVVCGLEFNTQKYLRLIAEREGFITKLVLMDDIRSRGLMTKRNKTASMINTEWVLVLQK